MKKKQRVPKGEKYWYIGADKYIPILSYDMRTIFDDDRYRSGNYFTDYSEAEQMARKLRIVLAGADVIEMPSEEALSNPWHKASEELPRKGGHYLCMDENKHIVQLAFCGTKWVNTSQFLNINLDLVKYWMEIPELPKEE